MYVSMHEWPLYPGTGALTETGSGSGLGTTVNFPMPAGATGDVYLRAVDDVVAPLVEAFGPTWLLVSAGFDAHRRDPITGLGLSSGDYGLLTARLLELVPPGRRLLMLEGGYDLQALADSTASALASLEGIQHHPEDPTKGGPGHQVVDAARRLWGEAGLL
jgi:acetoin utilization deacetylase AcuC-like enzyme